MSSCPPINGPPEAAERALWACADASVDMATFALVLCVGLLIGSLTLLYALHLTSVHYP
jgi:hypothetical protein